MCEGVKHLVKGGRDLREEGKPERRPKRQSIMEPPDSVAEDRVQEEANQYLGEKQLKQINRNS